jgi:hypothetical protein
MIRQPSWARLEPIAAVNYIRTFIAMCSLSKACFELLSELVRVRNNVGNKGCATVGQR